MIVPIADILHRIEEYRFSSELNLAAGTKAFRRGLREHDLVRKLADLAKDGDTRAAVVKRVEELSQAEIDPRYENRFDAALSAYLTVLGDTAQPETVAKAASAAAKAANCWWTAGISRELLMHAVATGFAQAPAVWQIDTAAILPGALWPEGVRDRLPQWFTQPSASVGDEAASRILSAVRAGQNQAQVPHASNLIVMPPPTEEGERIVWKARGRSRMRRHKAAQATVPSNPRAGRQFVRA